MKSSPRPADDELDRLVAIGMTRQQVEPGDDCLDAEVLAGYADGGLSAAERASADAHLARCRDCRRAVALLTESDPLTVSIAPESPAVGATQATQPAVAPGSQGTTGRSGLTKFATTWLPLAAALVVATGLWFAFTRSRQAPQLASAPAQLSARNEPSSAQPAAASGQSAPSTDQAGAATSRELLRESSRAAGAAPSDKESSPRADADAAAAPPQAPAPAMARARGTFREEAAAARPNASVEGDRRAAPGVSGGASGGAPAAAPAPAPPPPPPPSVALADAAPARVGGVAGREAQARGAGQLASPAAPAAAPQAAAPTQVAAANQNAPQQAGQPQPASQQAATQQTGQQQNATQQAVINQQTGPMANLNVAPPPAKTDERRQADASKRATNDSKQRDANEKSAGGPSNVKSVDGFAKAAAEEPKAVARAKAAPESPSATTPVDAVSTTTKSANAVSGRKTDEGGAADRAAAATAGARPAEASPERGIAESVTVITAAPAPGAVLRGADGARWWRIRAPSTIEGSTDRGATWTVEYSDPSARLVRGAAAAKGGCWMIGASGLVLRTRPNGGWERVTQPTRRNLVTLTATDHLIATVTDDQGRTYRTTDGGATWR